MLETGILGVFLHSLLHAMSFPSLSLNIQELKVMLLYYIIIACCNNLFCFNSLFSFLIGIALIFA